MQTMQTTDQARALSATPTTAARADIEGARRHTAQAGRQARKLLKKASGHGRAVLTLAQVWALPTILAMSLGAFVTLAGQGMPEWIVDAVRRAATIILLIGGDLAVVVALLRLGDGKHRGLRLRDQPLDILLVAVVAGMETWTFYLLIKGQTPDGPTDLLRAAQAVMTALYLGVLRKRMPNERDVTQVAGELAGERVIAKVQGMGLDDADLGTLFNIMRLALNGALSYGERATALVSAFQQLEPGTLRREMEAALAQVRAESAKVVADAQRQVERAQDAEERAGDEAEQQMLAALVHLLTRGTLPANLVERFPQLEGLDVTTFAQSAGRRRPADAEDREPRSKAERQRRMLKLAGIERPVRPPKSQQGVWISTADVGVLTGGKIREDDARDFIKRLPGSGQSSRYIVGRFAPTMEELYRRNLLTDRARESYESLRNVVELDGGQSDTLQGTRPEFNAAGA